MVAAVVVERHMNLGDAQAKAGDVAAASAAVQRAAAHLAALRPGGNRDFIALGIRRLAERVGAASDVGAATPC